MATTVTTYSGTHIVKLDDLLVKLWTDLTQSGQFTSILPSGTLTPPTIDPDGNGKFVIESSADVNPLHSTQPYRIYMEVVKRERIRVSVANPIQITDTGEVASYPGSSTFRASNIVGMLGTKWDDATSPENDFPTDTAWVVRSLAAYSSGDLSGAPLSYHISVADHGVAVFVWGDDMEQKPRSSWFVVQNPVDKTTGAPRIDQKSPIFCVYSNNNTPDGVITASQLITWLNKALSNNTPTSGTYSASTFVQDITKLLMPPIGGFTDPLKFDATALSFKADTTSVYKFVVSESDVFVPSPSVRADVDTEDSSAIINTKNQVAIAIGNKYLVTMPNRLNTQRYAYTDELDLIGYTSADVISQDSDVPVTVYGEASPRKYKAMKTSGPNNTGFRILVLTEV